MVADKGYLIDPQAASRIKSDMYVDDMLSGGTPKQVQRFVGKKINDSYNGTFSRILGIGNFKVKAFGISGDAETEESELMGSKVLGYDYDLEKDMLSIKFSINLSKKRRSIRSEPDLCYNDIASLRSKTLTKRILLGVTNSFGDFLGISSPFTIRFKVLMRQLFMLEKPLAWDEEIPVECGEAWISLLTETLEAGSLQFHRSTRPFNAIRGIGPTVVGFSDYGDFGFDARVYLRWRIYCSNCSELIKLHLEDYNKELSLPFCSGCLENTGGDHFAARLSLCKARVPPLTGLTVARGEMNGLTLQSRLMLVVILALQKLEAKPVSAVMLCDSKVAISAAKSKRALAPYFQNRTAEIIDNLQQMRRYCSIEDIMYVKSSDNPSDLSTKEGCSVHELGPDSLHQSGPTFLSWRRDLWPVLTHYEPSDIPDDELKVRDKFAFTAAARLNFCHTNIHESNPWKALEEILHYSNSFQKVKRIVARYLNGLQAGLSKNEKMNIENPVAYEVVSRWPRKHELESAERLMLLHGMVDTVEALNAGKLKTLLPYRDGRIIVTRGRLNGESMQKLLGVSQLPILMPESRIAFLYMVYAHCGEFGHIHRSVLSTLARSRNYVWVVKGRQLAKRVVRQCPKCDRERKELLMQQMGEIKSEQLTVSPPWTHICLDFAGPVYIKDEVKKRTRMKSWILVYTCRSTKAVCLLCCPGYSTEDFLTKHMEFISRYGTPASIVSDKGSQLVAAGNAIADKDTPCLKYNWGKIESSNPNTVWTFVPAKAQHRNGLAESTVKVLKRSLALSLGPGVELTFSEMITLLAQIACSINSRPLGLQSSSESNQLEDILIPLTPNQLLIGRSTSEPVKIEFEKTDKYVARQVYIQELFETWWKRWINEVLPTLVPCKRWRNAQVNLKKDDIVMMKYPNQLKDDYRIARVVEVFPDDKGLVRTVCVAYRRRDRREPKEDYWKKPLTKEVVAVQRLAVLQAAGESYPTGGLEDEMPTDVHTREAMVAASLVQLKTLKTMEPFT